MSQLIEYACQDHIGIVTINRPEKRNAMTGAMIARLLDVVRAAGENGEAHVLIVTGSGGSFCAGVDLNEVASKETGDTGLPERVEDRDKWWPAVECQIPVIAAIDGLAIGMGAEFTCQCDIRLATPRARFAWNFALRGLVPDSGAGTWLLPKLIGIQKTLKLLYSGDFLEAEEALACGYVERLVDPDKLLPTAMQLAQQICRASPFSTREIKRLVYDGLELSRDEHVSRSKAALERCFNSNDFQEGIQAFVEKREARFSGT